MDGITILPVRGIPEVREGDDVAAQIVEAALAGPGLEPGDVLVVTQKIVSKAEGRVLLLDGVTPSAEAQKLAAETEKDPRLVELILQESAGVVRQRGPVLITESHHGFVCANAGIDSSNVGPEGTVCLLPVDPDGSCRGIRDKVREVTGHDVALIMSDTFGRPWREGHTNVTIGLAGMAAFADYVGQTDSFGYELRVSTLCVADELAAAAELVQNKLDGVPVAIVRGYDYPKGDGSSRDLIRAREMDLFR